MLKERLTCFLFLSMFTGMQLKAFSKLFETVLVIHGIYVCLRKIWRYQLVGARRIIIKNFL